MPETIVLKDGSEREVLTADEQKDLSEKAANAAEAEESSKKHGVAVVNQRNHIKNLEKQLKEKGVDVKPLEGESLSADDIVRRSEEAARNVVQQNEISKLGQHKEKVLNNLSGGDENRKKVIEEQFARLTKDRVINDPKELEGWLEDAAVLSNKNRDSRVGSSGAGRSNGEPTGTPIRGNSATRSRGIEIAQAFGYTPKNKDLNK